MQQFNPRSINLSILTGRTAEISVDEFIFLDVSNVDLQISSDGGTFAPLRTKRGYRLNYGEKIGKVFIKNPSGVTATVVIITGTGLYIDGALGGNSSLGVTIDGPSPLPVSWSALGMAVAGPDADGSPAVGKPVQVAGKDAAANVQAVLTATDGRVMAECATSAESESGTHSFAAAGAVALIAAAGAGIRHKVGTFIVANPGGVDDVGILLDGVTEICRVAVKAGETEFVTFPIPAVGSAATALNGNIVVGGGTVVLSVVGYKAA